MPNPVAEKPARRSPANIATIALVYVVFLAIVVASPIAAAWAASSLAAHAGGSVRAAAATGLVVFPGVPVLWELIAAWRRRGSKEKRFLTLVDRVVLRTLVASVVFLSVLVFLSPERLFVALNARGDWMLDGRHDPRSERVRRAIYWLAARTTWLHRVTDNNPFRAGRGGRGARPKPLPSRNMERLSDVDRPTVRPSNVAPAPAAPHDPHTWPFAATLHPLVTAIPASEETTPQSVGRYLAAHEQDPWMLAKAVHDYVADRVAYDVPSYRAGTYPPQDADTVFHTHLAVCAGYAELFTAIGTAAGLHVETVVGHARGVEREGMGGAHAWNAVQLADGWHLLDATWDSGSVDADGFRKSYRTSYFLAPPEVFIPLHYPDEPRWQLLSPPRSEGEYMRLPMLRPDFFAAGMRLRAPDRGESDAHETARLVIENPQRRGMMVSAVDPNGARTHCEIEGDGEVTATCRLAGPDLYEIVIFAANADADSDANSLAGVTTYWSVGSIFVHNR